jgi:UV-stimulated scaffold protein A
MAQPVLDSAVLERLRGLLNAATDKNRPSVTPDELVELKSILRVSDAYITEAHEVLLDKLQENNSQVPREHVLQAYAYVIMSPARVGCQVRLLALEVVRDIFNRSKAFRGLLTANFKQFLALTVGYHIPLPPPSRSAERLRELALALLEAWQSQYASYYPQACLC